MPRRLVIDANILIRAVLGDRVHTILRDYANDVVFLTPQEAFKDAETYIPSVIVKFGGDHAEIEAALAKLQRLSTFIQGVPLGRMGLTIDAFLSTTVIK